MRVFRLRQHPQTLAELSESLKLLVTLQGDLAKTEAQIPLIHEQFAILDKYEVPVEQAVSTLLINKQIYTYTVNTIQEYIHTYCDCICLFTVVFAPCIVSQVSLPNIQLVKERAYYCCCNLFIK